MATKFATLSAAILAAEGMLKYHSKEIHSGMWQGWDISKKPEAAMKEIMYYSMDVDLKGIENIQYYRDEIKPNLPWADDHFAERVCGEPLNPGKTWVDWPYAHSAANARDDDGQFNHNYMERYWPKCAGETDRGELKDTFCDTDYRKKMGWEPLGFAHIGIRNYYGDILDLVNLFVKDPYTRQGYLPIYFPEDTGLIGRKPCTLGYMFFNREGRWDITYTIRSCDFIRHFRDDIYMTILLQRWFLQQLRERDSAWYEVKMGRFRMEIGSLHLFVNDFTQLTGGAS